VPWSHGSRRHGRAPRSRSDSSDSRGPGRRTPWVRSRRRGRARPSSGRSPRETHLFRRAHGRRDRSRLRRTPGSRPGIARVFRPDKDSCPELVRRTFGRLQLTGSNQAPKERPGTSAPLRAFRRDALRRPPTTVVATIATVHGLGIAEVAEHVPAAAPVAVYVSGHATQFLDLPGTPRPYGVPIDGDPVGRCVERGLGKLTAGAGLPFHEARLLKRLENSTRLVDGRSGPVQVPGLELDAALEGGLPERLA